MYPALRGDYGLHKRPTTLAIGKIVNKLEGTEELQILKGLCIIVSLVTISISLRSQELILSYGILWCVLHLLSHLHPYKIQLTQ